MRHLYFTIKNDLDINDFKNGRKYINVLHHHNEKTTFI